MKTSLVIDGDSSGATKAVDDATRAVGQLDAAGKGAAGSLAAEARAQGEVATSARTLAAAQGQAAGATRDAGQAAAAGAIEQRRRAAAESESERAAAAAALAQLKLGEAQRKLGQGSGAVAGALKGTTDEMNRQQFGMRNLGQQFGDLGLSIAGGISPARAFGQQAGQLGYALSEMGGKAGAVGAFLVGPWGIFLTVATAALAPFVEELFKTETAAGAAELAVTGLASAQGVLGESFNLATGAIKEQNEFLRANMALQAAALRSEAAAKRAKAQTVANDVGDYAPIRGIRVGAKFADVGPFENMAFPTLERSGTPARATAQQKLYDDVIARRVSIPDAVARSEKMDFRGLKVSGVEFRQMISDSLSAQQLDMTAAGVDRTRTTGALDPMFRRDAPGKRTPRPRKERDGTAAAARLQEYGNDTADKIAGIVGQFDAAPGAIDKISGKIRELDNLIREAGSKRPDNFRELIASAEAAKETVRTGIVRELGEAFAKPKTLADRATTAFGQLDAVAKSLEGRTGPQFDKTIAQLGEARRAITEGLNEPLNDFLGQQREQYAQGQLIAQGRTVEAEAMRTIVAIERQRGALLPAQRAEIVASVAALRMQEGQLERVRAKQQVNLDALEDQRDIIRQTISEGPKSLAALPGRILASFKSYSVDKITEDLFGNLFRDLREQATGAKKVDDATGTLVDAFTEAATSARDLSGALASASGGGSGAVASAVPGAIGGAGAGAGAAALGLVSALVGSGRAAPGAVVSPNADARSEIVVTGQRRFAPYEKAIGGAVEKIAGFFTKPEAAEQLGKSIGKSSGAALGGALQGQAAAGFAGMLGVKTSNTGAGIGGAIGGLTGIPGGAIIGGLLGGIAGGLLKKTKSGSATFGDTTSEATTGGNSRAFGKVASGLAGSVQDAVAQIAEQLGGAVGSFGAITIGKRGDDFRVNAGGTSLKKAKGAKDFDEDEGAATAYAIRLAVERGAVQGLSTAVQKALGSSQDINRGLKEALGVQELELFMGGALAQYQKAFREFEGTAKERVRIARDYGFDVVAIEKRNADDRLKLADQLGRAQTGSLKSLVDEMTRGNLFEGTAADRIGALDTAIAKAKTDLEANVEGAGDTLARLLGDKLSASRDAYGTTGAYAADRNAVIGEAQSAIARTNARVAAADASKQQTSDPALATTNQALDENNDQNERMITALNQNNRLLASLLSKREEPVFAPTGRQVSLR